MQGKLRGWKEVRKIGLVFVLTGVIVVVQHREVCQIVIVSQSMCQENTRWEHFYSVFCAKANQIFIFCSSFVFIFIFFYISMSFRSVYIYFYFFVMDVLVYGEFVFATRKKKCYLDFVNFVCIIYSVYKYKRFVVYLHMLRYIQ